MVASLFLREEPVCSIVVPPRVQARLLTCEHCFVSCCSRADACACLCFWLLSGCVFYAPTPTVKLQWQLESM